MIKIAHRGYSGRYPENTRIAFEKAVENGFTGVELDVHMCNSGELVIVHDENLERTSGFNGLIKDMSFMSLTRIPVNNDLDVPDQYIMTLEEFLEEFHDKFKLINVEIKNDFYTMEGIIPKVAKLLEEYRDKANFVVSSFRLETVKEFKAISSIPVAYLVEDMDRIRAEKDFDGIGYLHPWFRLLKYVLPELQEYNLPINTWTVNTEEDWKMIMALPTPINAIITNYRVWDGEYGPIQELSERDQKRVDGLLSKLRK